jgi:DNA-binding winged helix-turn-helix (wHTH) protein/TolB-like protein
MDADRKTIRFEDFEFDARSGELRRGNSRTRLEPQPARLLMFLIERAGNVVTRAELQERVWGGGTFVDFEHGLNYGIAQIRAALGDSASQPRFIETLPRRGYRFIAPVAAVDASMPAPAHTMPTRRTLARPLGALLAGVGVLLLAATAQWMRDRRAPAPASPQVRIAVVPFDNETGVAAYDRLAQSLTDATVARLAEHPDRVAVIGNAAVLRGPRETRDLMAIGRTLGVDHVVLGQVQDIDGRLRITTHLIRVSDQAHVWARRFEPEQGQAAPLDRAVADAVAGAVATRLLTG